LKPVFIPFFPFLYENIANGNLIVDEQKKFGQKIVPVRLTLQKKAKKVLEEMYQNK